MLLVHQVMTVRPVTVTPRTTIAELLGEFDRHDFNAFPVVQEGGRVAGIVTKLDVLRALAPRVPDLRGAEHVAEMPVEAIMRRGVVAVEPDDPVGVAADLMVETRLRSLPVVQRPRGSERMLVGILSQGDLLRGFRLALADERIAAALEAPAGHGP
jgi:CBS domain-containing protein